MASRAETTHGLRGRSRARHRAGHLSGCEHGLHRSVRVRPVEHAVRGTVPPTGDHRDRRLAARCRPERSLRGEARLPRRAGEQPALDGPAHRQPVLHHGPVGRLCAPAAGHGLPGSRLRAHRAHPEHLCGRLQPGESRPCDPGPERPAGTRHRPGAGVRRHLRRPRLLVGAAGDVGGAVARAAGRERAPTASGRSATTGRGAGQSPASGAVLGLRGLCRPLRHLRDPERQLVAARPHERARRVDDRGRSGSDGVLGHGHARTGPLRRQCKPGCRHA